MIVVLFLFLWAWALVTWVLVELCLCSCRVVSRQPLPVLSLVTWVCHWDAVLDVGQLVPCRIVLVLWLLCGCAGFVFPLVTMSVQYNQTRPFSCYLKYPSGRVEFNLTPRRPLTTRWIATRFIHCALGTVHISGLYRYFSRHMYAFIVGIATGFHDLCRFDSSWR